METKKCVYYAASRNQRNIEIERGQIEPFYRQGYINAGCYDRCNGENTNCRYYSETKPTANLEVEDGFS